MLKISLYFFLDIFQHVFKIFFINLFLLSWERSANAVVVVAVPAQSLIEKLHQLVYLLFKFSFTKFCHPKFCNFAYNFWILSFKFLFLTSKKFSFLFFCFCFIFFWFCFCKFVVLKFTPRENYPNMAERLQFCSLVFRFQHCFRFFFLLSLSFLGFKRVIHCCCCCH